MSPVDLRSISKAGVDGTKCYGQSRTPVPTELLFGTKRTTDGKLLQGGFVNRTVEDACPYKINVGLFNEHTKFVEVIHKSTNYEIIGDY